ncbi:MAG TPA: hypothetical protein PKC95_00385 [Thauera aminoaromatica]|nr:hypothetical protein [Thauera aminoaromatica]
MARPRTPAKILELRGAFKKHPERRREPIAPAGEFNPQPPAHLPQECTRAWHWLVEQMPPGVLSASDYASVEIMARLQTQIWVGQLQFVSELRQWFGQYGLTAAAREKIAAKAPADKGNPFSSA